MLTTTQLLHRTSLDILTTRLTELGNELSHEHVLALSAMLECFAKLTMGEVTGRWSIPLAASMGKSQAAISFIIAAHQLRVAGQLRDSFALTVAATKIEDLAEMLRHCREAGVPDEDLGLSYSRSRFTYDAAEAKKYLEDGTPLPPGHVSEPATSDLSTRRYVFVSHARAELPEETKPGRSQESRREAERKYVDGIALYKGMRRAITIWDETFLKSAPWSITLAKLDECAGALDRAKNYNPHLSAVADYIETCIQIVKSAVSKGTTVDATFPELAPEARTQMYHAIRRATNHDTIESFLTTSAYPIRLAPESGNDAASLYRYNLRVSPQLDPLVVLDASTHIRYVSKLDTTLKMWPGIPVDIKKFPDLDIYVNPTHTGKDGVRRDFQRYANSHWLRELVHTMQTYDGKFLVITFLDEKPSSSRRRASGVDDTIPGRIKAGLRNAGIPSDRYTVINFGSETATSRYKDHGNVFFVGQLNKPRGVYRALIVGQQDNLSAAVTNQQIRDTEIGEHAHSTYQGANRGTMRTVVKGIAAPQRLFFCTPYPRQMRSLLDEMFPEARWHEWDTKFIPTITPSEAMAVSVVDVTDLIVDYVRVQPHDEAGEASSTEGLRVSSRRVKAHCEDRCGGPIAPVTFTKARVQADQQLALEGWTFTGGSYHHQERKAA
jgi:hypothetical protein